MPDYSTPPIQATAHRSLSPKVGPLTPGVDDEDSARQLGSSPSFDYHQERRLHLKDEIWLSHHLPRLPPTTSDDIGAAKSGPSNSPPRARTTPNDIMKGQAADSNMDPSPSAFHPTRQEVNLPHLERGGRSMSMDGDEQDEEDETALRKGAGQNDLLSPAIVGGANSRPGLIHRRELDSQEALDLEEERREREMSGGLGQAAEQAAGPSASAPQPDSSTSSPPSPQTPQTPQMENQLLIQLQLLAFAEHGIGSELEELYSSFAKCLDLRDKYLALSHQRLGDNPRDHDGTFSGFYPRTAADTMGLKADADPETCEKPTSTSPKQDLPAWQIYPPPPPPHWHWKPAPNGPQVEFQDSTSGGRDSGAASPPMNGRSDMHNFRFEHCEIPPVAQGAEFALNDEGVYEVYVNHDDTPQSVEPSSSAAGGEGTSTPGAKGKQKIQHVPSLKEYFTDLDYLLGVCSDGPAKSFAFRRLKYLSSKWSLYCLLNEYQELADMKAVPHRDFYNVRKVDTHIHHSASMNQKHLLRFIKSKLKKNPNEIVIHRDGKDLTLQEVFESLNLTAYDLSIDTLDMHAHQEFHRFDRFNDRYNPTGSSRLREIFLKTDNLLKGKYLAELTQELITDLEQSKYQQSEWRLSIYGRNLGEWDKLAKWVVGNNLISHNVRWLIQVPRLYEVFKGAKLVENFEDVVRNVFQPLFEVTKDPSSHPELHVFLQRVVGFDSVDDESKPERRLYRKFPTARMWDTKQSPPYSYWIYYMYANMASLNGFRRSRGFNTFVLRPHCGEAGDPDHLSSAFLTSHSISHGILLRKVPALQYLFYLKQVGLAMSPLSNNALFLTYERNPFKDFFRTGLNVSLSTDDPLQFHFTASHLLEEYSCAAQIYKLTPADMCELARNSVLQSGWEMQVKKHWIGQKWYMPGATGNDIHKTNVPTIRLAYRHATLLEELALIHHGNRPAHSASAPGSTSATPTPGPQPSRSPSAPFRKIPTTSSTEPSSIQASRPGMPTQSSDVAAAAMAMGNMNLSDPAYPGSTSASLTGHGFKGAESVSRVGAGMNPEYLVGGLGEMDERQRKRSGSLGKGLGGDKLDMSHEVRR